MELNWIVKFYANKISTNDFGFVWNLIQKEILADSIECYKWNELSDLPDYLQKPDKLEGEIKAEGECWYCSSLFIVGILDKIKNELGKLNIDFVFSAYSANQINSSIFYDSKTSNFIVI